MDPYELKKMSAMKLSKWQAGYKRDTHNFILAENEWRRREMQEQHRLNSEVIKQQYELNLKIFEKQKSTTYWAALLGSFLTK